MRITMSGAALALLLLAGTADGASACSSETRVDDSHSNSVTIRTSCAGAASVGTVAPSSRPAAIDVASGPAEADDALADIEVAARSRSFFAAVADALFGGRHDAASTDTPAANGPTTPGRDAAAETTASGRDEAAEPRRSASREGVEETARDDADGVNVFCAITVAGSGRARSIGLMVDADVAVAGGAIATVEARRGGSVARFRRDVELDLAAGSGEAFELARTNLAHGARLAGSLEIEGRHVPCLP